MIPKRAIFYWAGEPMSWLRRQSVETFRALNPSWTVDLLDGGTRENLLDRVHASDVARYAALQDGGIYFDTDIVFCRPIPESWLKHDLILPLDHLGQLGHIASLGACDGSAFFRAVSRRAVEVVNGSEFLSYQALGVELLRSVMNTMSVGREDVKWISHDHFVIASWNEVPRVWNTWALPFPEQSIGIHWYGGDHLSRMLEPIVDEQWMANNKRSLLAQAWAKAQSSCAEVIKEQHGLA